MIYLAFNWVFIRIKVLASKDAPIKLSITTITRDAIFEGRNSVGWLTKFIVSRLGFGSYIGKRCHFSNVKIGRYCSIANNVKVIYGNHPSKIFVSSHPAFYSLTNFPTRVLGFNYINKQKFDQERKLTSAGYASEIGNDVWIGDDVRIMEGVKVGNGAILASCSLITKDVAPYAIVGGVPAKLIRFRFSEEDRCFLEKLKWWEKSERWIRNNSSAFEDVSELKRRCAL